MSSFKRKGSYTSATYNANDAKLRTESKGTKPLPSPISVGGALVNAILFGCRRFMFFNTNLRVIACVAFIFISFVFDMYPLPRSYFSQSSNVLNQVFVKLGWAWTLALTLPFVGLTSLTNSCGNRKMVGRHLSRLCVATVVWWTATTSFVALENRFGACSVKGEKFANKQSCLKGGHFWDSFDISGHAFILIYSILIMIEESKAVIGWESIADLIRNETHDRSKNTTDYKSPLNHLTSDEFRYLSASFTKYSPYVRALFIALTLLTLLWHVMVISTVLYFHKMVEKLIGAAIAIVMWYVTYRYWYTRPNLLLSPGSGSFQYCKVKYENGTSFKNSAASSKAQSPVGPKFMGMPLYTNKVDEVTSSNKTANISKTSVSNNVIRTGPVTRSQKLLDDSL